MITIFWFRRDLRLHDNHGLYRALLASDHVLPVFIFDTLILEKLDNREDRRVNFIHEQVSRIKADLEKKGSSLLVKHGKPVDVFEEITGTYQVKDVYTNHDYEPYARRRDDEVKHLLTGKGIGFHTFKDQVIFEKSDILKDNGDPYTVYTPYMKRWKIKYKQEMVAPYDTEGLMHHLHKTRPFPLLSPEETGFKTVSYDFPEMTPDRQIIINYDKTRDYPAIKGTSRMSVHLRFGTVSIRALTALGTELNHKWLNELIWREFYMYILWHFPHVAEHSFRPEYDRIPWRNNEDEFKAWCRGNTGYPIVDAGMRELNTTGYMHNRVRMIAASFLVKHLLIDWRWGEAYFAVKLLDYELSSNNGGWQWAAGSGVDAAPYFRIFNPYIQEKKFDPDKEYIKKWIPEPDNTSKYPQPIVDHKFARNRAINTYKDALR